MKKKSWYCVYIIPEVPWLPGQQHARYWLKLQRLYLDAASFELMFLKALTFTGMFSV